MFLLELEWVVRGEVIGIPAVVSVGDIGHAQPKRVPLKRLPASAAAPRRDCRLYKPRLPRLQTAFAAFP